MKNIKRFMLFFIWLIFISMCFFSAKYGQYNSVNLVKKRYLKNKVDNSKLEKKLEFIFYKNLFTYENYKK